MIGNAHSLWRLCRECLVSKKPVVIMEDDVKIHHELYSFLTAHEDRLSAMDFVALGHNTDAPAVWQTEGGLVYASLHRPRNPTYEWIEHYLRRTAVGSVRIYRLLNMFGTCCFLVTPSGAEKILNLGLPLTLEGTRVPFVDNEIRGISLDRRLNAVYQKMNASICIPPLALSPNDDSSTKEHRVR